ncbi:MAG: hypothetical protein ABSH45_17900 [Bryobacteraceae bacterium]|jgi:hypothetical protein
MSSVLEKLLVPAVRLPEEPAAREAHSALNIAVVCTSIESTLPALRTAATLANRLRARITLMVPQVVPYPLPLTTPPVPLDFTERRFRVLAEESPVETTVCICLCRNRVEALTTVLRPYSLVVIGDSGSWWPSEEKRMARQLRRAGHDVVLAEA